MDKGGNDFQFGNYSSSPSYKKLVTSSEYLTMRDGVRLAATIIMPTPVPEGVKLPALLYQTRYWRAIDYRWPLNWLNKFNKKLAHPYLARHGYAVILVDVRGTGASFGSWPHPWDEKSIEDAREIVDWIIGQPWSNGLVGAYGGSYVGTTAELLAVLQHPAVRAVLPMYNHPNPFTDITHPGGAFNEKFISQWSALDRSLDYNRAPRIMGWQRHFMRSVMPVDEDTDRKLLNQAVDDHKNNGVVEMIARHITFIDVAVEFVGLPIENLSVERHKQKLLDSPAVICGWASWLDAATADAALRRFLTLPQARRLVIGPWIHGGYYFTSPYSQSIFPRSEKMAKHFNEYLRYFDSHLKEEGDPNTKDQRNIVYYNFGEERWRQSEVWPPEGHRFERWHLAEKNTLIKENPVVSIADKYLVDWDASSGDTNRWWELIALEKRTVAYPNRTAQALHVLAYQSPPLKEDLQITGQPIVNLHFASSEPDGLLFIYLEEVDERGKITYLTEGQLRLIHHKVSASVPDYEMLVPFHSFKADEASPLTAEEPVEIKLGLLATSVLVPSGHRLRLSITGHDQGTFTKINHQEELYYKIYSDGESPSWIDLPVIERS